MPLQLRIEVPSEPVSTWEGLRVGFQLTNDTDRTLEIPHPAYDRTDALTLELYPAGGPLLRRMNGYTSQLMMTLNRLDASRTLAALQQGETWDWSLDFSFYHYAIAPGVYELEAVYEYPEQEIVARSTRRRVTITGERLLQMEAVRESPVVDGLSLLFRVQNGAGHPFFLRQHSYDRPLAAWYSAPVLAGIQVQTACFATLNYYRFDTFDHFFYKWLVAVSGDQIRAFRYFFGQPGEIQFAGRVPDGRELISAYATVDNRVYTVFRTPSNTLENYELAAAGLVKIFEHPIPAPPASLLSVRAEEKIIHLVHANRGLVYERLNLQGGVLEQRRLYNTRLRCRSLVFDPVSKRAQALFFDGPHSPIIQMAVAHLERTAADSSVTLALPFHQSTNEIAFDCSTTGRFHLLVSTSSESLYYLTQDRGPMLIAQGERRFFPIVLSPRKLYLGCYRSGVGYRFLQFDARQWRSRIVDFEAASQVPPESSRELE